MQIDINLHSGSQIRPMKMMQAFKDIGYDVDIVMGYIDKRKEQIQQVKQNIANGIKYDFLYSESSTMPTALTEKHHFPIAPFLDFSFFKFCKINGIKIGLFYRDVYWVFDNYKKAMPVFKYYITKIFYNMDLIYYKKYVDILYLPSIQMSSFIPFNFKNKFLALPPGLNELNNNRINKKTLNFIYVGGLSESYNLVMFTQLTSKLNDLVLNLCVRQKEWVLNKNKYIDNLKNIVVHHKNGNELSDIYNNSDIAVYFVKPNKLWNFAVGVKLFEYIAYKKPIIAVKNTAIGNFVQQNDIGWVINYNEIELKELIQSLQENPSQIEEKIKNIEKIIPKHTWKARVNQVEMDMKKC
jgi:glycosyltransferase involved in cell wall biosynthesis